MNMDSLKITVVLPTYNRSKDLDNCLKSLTTQNLPPYEIIVVDDCSSDDTRKISTKYAVTYTRNSKRRRQSYSKNRGIEKSKTDLVAFIDDDCIANREWLENLKKSILSNENIGIVGGRIIGLSGNWDKISDRSRTSKPFQILLRILFLKTNQVGKIHINGFVDSNFHRDDYQGEVDWASAGNMLINKKIVSVRFDEDLKGNCRFEEPDFCFRAKKNDDVIIIYCPSALVNHNFSKNSRIKFFDDLYFRKRNHMYFIFKNKIFTHFSLFYTFYFLFSQIIDVFACFFLCFKDKRFLMAMKGKMDGINDFICK